MGCRVALFGFPGVAVRVATDVYDAADWLWPRCSSLSDFCEVTA